MAPRSIPTLNNLAVAQFEQNKIAAAVRTAETAIAIDAKNIDAYFMLLNCEQKQNSYDDALRTCDKIIAIDPGLAEAHYHRGQVLNRLGDYPKALASFDRAISIRRRNSSKPS